jgi:hypothetical protein
LKLGAKGNRRGNQRTERMALKGEKTHVLRLIEERIREKNGFTRFIVCYF